MHGSLPNLAAGTWRVAAGSVPRHPALRVLPFKPLDQTPMPAFGIAAGSA